MEYHWPPIQFHCFQNICQAAATSVSMGLISITCSEESFLHTSSGKTHLTCPASDLAPKASHLTQAICPALPSLSGSRLRLCRTILVSLLLQCRYALRHPEASRLHAQSCNTAPMINYPAPRYSVRRFWIQQSLDNLHRQPMYWQFH